MSEPKQKVALVTGAASGIGASIAERFAGDGHKVVAIDRHPDIAGIAGRYGGEGWVVDLAENAQIEALIARIAKDLGGLDIVVNNAGINPKINGKRAVSETMPLSQWAEVLQVNLTAPFLICRLAIPLMRKNGWGRMINIASRAGRAIVPTAGAHYSATKAGVIGFSRTLANELGPEGITVNCIAPGRIETPLSEQGAPEMLAALKAEIPVGRAGKPSEIASLVSYLASEESGFITGAVHDVNGGVTMI
ncbi:SDR family NAD(P)-dependent oxidoreductase [Oceanicola sp. 502str15]|uniref:SDR family NAD(P)-dependent oxidoreductase n=1 Tax=Oceanicola sp. 502str15 TaxID=2696061 RepID=UPI00209657B6|nr:SDR family NAD(P)-dependent oxidoreductase [Oceanicola sp. 502str15]MCO6385292.1 SDR family oxidoreductase [Oceanicola sp. 502str15]